MNPTEEQTYRASIDDKLDLILQQTTKHNGRLTKIELANVRLSTRINTSIAILTFIIGTIAVPLAVAYLQSS